MPHARLESLHVVCKGSPIYSHLWNQNSFNLSLQLSVLLNSLQDDAGAMVSQVKSWLDWFLLTLIYNYYCFVAALFYRTAENHGSNTQRQSWW